MSNYEMLLNWTKKTSPAPNMQESMEKIAQIMDKKIEEGISISGAIEIIAATTSFPFEAIKRVGETRQQEINIAMMGDDFEEGDNFPKNYDDVASQIHELIQSESPEFVTEILGGIEDDYPSVIDFAEDTDRKSFVKLVAMAKNNKNALNGLDDKIRDSVDAAIEDSQILAQKLVDGNTEVEENNDGNYIVKNDDTDQCSVNMNAKTCTCPRYTLGGFKYLGLACEHILYIDMIGK